MIVMIDPIAIIFMEISRCVRLTFTSTLLLPFISFAASPTALLMILHDFTIPITPAMAIPPIPMLLAYSLNIISGLIAPTVMVISGFHIFKT